MPLNIGINKNLNVYNARRLTCIANINPLAYVLNKLHINKVENAYHATIQIFGIMIQINANPAQQLMFIINKEEDVYVRKIYLTIQEFNAFNA